MKGEEHLLVIRWGGRQRRFSCGNKLIWFEATHACRRKVEGFVGKGDDDFARRERLEVFSEGEGLIFLAVDEKDGAEGRLSEDPLGEATLVGVGTERVVIVDGSIDGDNFAIDAHILLLIEEEAAESIFGAETDEDDARIGVGEVAFEMMEDAAGLAHAGGGDDDERPGLGAKGTGFFGGDDMVGLEAGKSAFGAVGHVEDVRVAHERTRGFDGEWAVDVERYVGQFTGINEAAQFEDETLGTANRVGRDDYDTPSGESGAEVAGEVTACVLIRAVLGGAVGAFKDREFGCVRDGGFGHDPVVGAAEVTGVDKRAGAFGGGFAHDDRACAGDVAGRDERGAEVRPKGNFFVPFDRSHECKSLADVVVGIEIGERRKAAFEAALIELRSLDTEDVGTIGEEQ